MWWLLDLLLFRKLTVWQGLINGLLSFYCLNRTYRRWKTTLDTIGSITGSVIEAEPGELVLEKPTIKKPPMFKVILLNDDFTPMDFVVDILKRFFRKEDGDAVRIMLDVHTKGSGVCGVYTREIAETKVELVTQCARRSNHPLKCIYEHE